MSYLYICRLHSFNQLILSLCGMIVIAHLDPREFCLLQSNQVVQWIPLSFVQYLLLRQFFQPEQFAIEKYCLVFFNKIPPIRTKCALVRHYITFDIITYYSQALERLLECTAQQMEVEKRIWNLFTNTLKLTTKFQRKSNAHFCHRYGIAGWKLGFLRFPSFGSRIFFIIITHHRWMINAIFLSRFGSWCIEIEHFLTTESSF